jgi:N-acyl homoserine lactone hydrolase
MVRGPKRLFVLPVGHIENDLAWNVAGISAASRKEPHRPAQWVRVPCLAYLIEHSELGWVLYDTGFRAEDPCRLPAYVQEQFPASMTDEETLAVHLKKLALSPSDIARIVVSHMHWDHGGGLALFNGLSVGQHIMAGDRDFAYGLTVTHRNWAEPFGGGGYFREHFDIPGIAFDLVDPSLGDFDLASGLRVIQLEGHTPQILGLLVSLPKSGPFLLPSDALYMKRNLEPPSPPGLIYDSLGFQRSAMKVQQLMRTLNPRIIFPHDPDQMENLKVAPEFYD